MASVAGVYRCKGIIHSEDEPQRRAVLQVVGRRCEVDSEQLWNEQTPITQIVAIGSPGKFDAGELKDLFDSCIAGSRLESNSTLPGVTTNRI